MGYIIFGVFWAISGLIAVSALLDGSLTFGIIGLVFVNLMSFTLGVEINKGTDSDVIKRN